MATIKYENINKALDMYESMLNYGTNNRISLQAATKEIGSRLGLNWRTLYNKITQLKSLDENQYERASHIHNTWGLQKPVSPEDVEKALTLIEEKINKEEYRIKSFEQALREAGEIAGINSGTLKSKINRRDGLNTKQKKRAENIKKRWIIKPRLKVTPEKINKMIGIMGNKQNDENIGSYMQLVRESAREAELNETTVIEMISPSSKGFERLGEVQKHGILYVREMLENKIKKKLPDEKVEKFLDEVLGHMKINRNTREFKKYVQETAQKFEINPETAYDMFQKDSGVYNSRSAYLQGKINDILNIRPKYKFRVPRMRFNSALILLEKMIEENKNKEVSFRASVIEVGKKVGITEGTLKEKLIYKTNLDAEQTKRAEKIIDMWCIKTHHEYTSSDVDRVIEAMDRKINNGKSYDATLKECAEELELGFYYVRSIFTPTSKYFGKLDERQQNEVKRVRETIGMKERLADDKIDKFLTKVEEGLKQNEKNFRSILKDVAGECALKEKTALNLFTKSSNTYNARTEEHKRRIDTIINMGG